MTAHRIVPEYDLQGGPKSQYTPQYSCNRAIKLPRLSACNIDAQKNSCGCSAENSAVERISCDLGLMDTASLDFL